MFFFLLPFVGMMIMMGGCPNFLENSNPLLSGQLC